MSLNYEIALLLSGVNAKEIVETVDGASASYAISLMAAGYSEKEAIRKATQLTGHAPDDAVFYMATTNHGTYNKNPLRNWLKQGHHNPRKSPDYLDPAGNSL